MPATILALAGFERKPGSLKIFKFANKMAKRPLNPDFEKFLIILVDFSSHYAKTVSLRSMMNVVGVNKTDCLKYRTRKGHSVILPVAEPPTCFFEQA